jgi:hypothetical protein
VLKSVDKPKCALLNAVTAFHYHLINFNAIYYSLIMCFAETFSLAVFFLNSTRPETERKKGLQRPKIGFSLIASSCLQTFFGLAKEEEGKGEVEETQILNL